MFTAKAFSIIELYGDGENSRSIHDTTNFFYREVMKLKTPLKSLPNVVDVINSMKQITPASGTLYQFIIDLQATKPESLWPQYKGPPKTASGIVFEAAHAIAPKIQNIPTSRVHPDIDIVETETTNKRRKIGPKRSRAETRGRRSGSRNWSKTETEILLDIIKEVLPCGSDQWEEVASQLYNAGFESRDANACKLKFDKLHTTPKPTGTSAIPRFVAMAKDIKEAISAEEVIGISVLNDDDKDPTVDAINGTHLFDEEERMKRPATKRTRSNDIVKAMEDHGKCFIDAAKILGDDFKGAFTTEIDDDFNKKIDDSLSKLTNKFDSKIAQIETQIKSQIETQIKSQISSVETKLDAILLCFQKD